MRTHGCAVGHTVTHRGFLCTEMFSFLFVFFVFFGRDRLLEQRVGMEG